MARTGVHNPIQCFDLCVAAPSIGAFNEQDHDDNGQQLIYRDILRI